MAETVLVDNDVALKACCYGAVAEVTTLLAGATRTLYILGAARYVLENAIAKGKNVTDKAQAKTQLTQLLSSVVELEPNKTELDLAAQFEEAALIFSDSALHGGESQLLAVLIKRACIFLVTGDKRAIRAIEPVLNACSQVELAEQRVACFEQIMTVLVGRYGAEALHPRICSERSIDKTMAICFKCVSGCYTSDAVVESLASYIRDLRRDAQRVLVECEMFSTMVA